MRDSFLVGDFLPGYTSSYHYKEAWPPHEAPEDPARWAARRDALHRRTRSLSAYYGLRFQAGLVAALLLVVLAFRIPYRPETTLEFVPVEQEIVAMEEIEQTRQEVLPPPPPRPPVPVEVPDDAFLDESDLDLDASLDIDQAVVDLPPPPPASGPTAEEEPEVFVAVEQMPTLIGGVAALRRAVQYPTAARKQGLEGVVVIKVIVTEDGTPTDPQVFRSAGALLDQAAVAAVMQQRFEPGRQRGRPVKVEISLPVQFRLTQ